MAKLQCPNCGEYKTEAHSIIVSIVEFLFFASIFGIVPVFLLLATVLGKYLAVALGKYSLYSLAIIPILVAAIPLSLFLLSKSLSANCPNLVSQICGYIWNRHTISEGTQFNVKSDLIEKGNILLEQKEAERQRQR